MFRPKKFSEAGHSNLFFCQPIAPCITARLRSLSFLLTRRRAPTLLWRLLCGIHTVALSASMPVPLYGGADDEAPYFCDHHSAIFPELTAPILWKSRCLLLPICRISDGRKGARVRKHVINLSERRAQLIRASGFPFLIHTKFTRVEKMQISFVQHARDGSLGVSV